MESGCNHMKHVWQLLNVVYIVLGLLGGYSSMAPERLRHTNPDPILCGILLILMPVFALAAVYYTVQRSSKDIVPSACKLRRPGWNRNPLNWWGDPLQSLFIAGSFMAAMAVGAALRRPTFGSVAFWTVGAYCCMAVGLRIGELFASRVFRRFLVN